MESLQVSLRSESTGCGDDLIELKLLRHLAPSQNWLRVMGSLSARVVHGIFTGELAEREHRVWRRSDRVEVASPSCSVTKLASSDGVSVSSCGSWNLYR